jgi:hypothetical protein
MVKVHFGALPRDLFFPIPSLAIAGKLLELTIRAPSKEHRRHFRVGDYRTNPLTLLPVHQ